MLKTKKHFAFSLAELIIALVVVSIVILYTVSFTINSDSAKNKKLSVSSKTFYSNVVSIFQDIITIDTTNYSLKTLNEKSSSYLAEKFNERLDGELLDDCSKLNIASGEVFDKENLICSQMNANIIAGFFYDENCKTTVTVKEYLELSGDSEIETREIQNACGYILYGFNNGNGVFGKDLFSIALGRREIK